MRINILITLIFLAPVYLLQAQDFEIFANSKDGTAVNIPNNKSAVFPEAVNSLFVRCITEGDENKPFTMFVDGKQCTNTIKGRNAVEIKTNPAADMREKKIEIKDGSGVVRYQFTLLLQREFEIQLGEDAGSPLSFDEEDNSTVAIDDAAEIFIRVKSPANTDFNYKVIVDGKECSRFKGQGGNHQKISCPGVSNLVNSTIQITDLSGDVVFKTFTIKGKVEDAEDKKLADAPLPPAIEEIKGRFPSLAITTFGLQVPPGNKNTNYTGRKYVHIFLDQFGNNVFSTIPQGISNRQYVVHIFYLEDIKEPNQVDYSINQTAGEFQETLVFNNAGSVFSFKAKTKKDARWAHEEFLLSTSTTDIKFDVVRTAVKDEKATRLEFETQVLKNYTIKMSKVYHGSFDVGLINSTLENPEFELVASASNASEKVVKETEGSNRGVVTVMATFYTSPVILLESLFGSKEIPTYKLSGRNFLDDHKIYERIYPAVGVGFTDKTLENLFFGFNWEFARGGSIFLGWHYGKVNVYNAPPGFVFEKTPVSQEEFDLYSNRKWETSFAFGLNLDVLIVRNLFRGGSAGNQ